jgi:trans-aconitate methyltransferase
MPDLARRVVHEALGRLGLKLSMIRNIPLGNDLCLDLARFAPAGSMRILFDVGANVGRMALKLARTFPAARIYGFEPIASTFRTLAEATAGVDQIRCFHFAMGSAAGEAQVDLGAMYTNALFACPEAFGRPS